MGLAAERLSWVEIALMLALGMRNPAAAARVLAAVAGVYVSSEAVGRAAARERPFARDDGVEDLVDHAARRSFPSRHAASAVAMATVTMRYSRPLGTVMAVVAALLGLSRVAAGLHYPSDVLAGAVLGQAIGSLARSQR